MKNISLIFELRHLIYPKIIGVLKIEIVSFYCKTVNIYICCEKLVFNVYFVQFCCPLISNKSIGIPFMFIIQLLVHGSHLWTIDNCLQ